MGNETNIIKMLTKLSPANYKAQREGKKLQKRISKTQNIARNKAAKQQFRLSKGGGERNPWKPTESPRPRLKNKMN